MLNEIYNTLIPKLCKQKFIKTAPAWMSKNILKQNEVFLLNSAVGNLLRHTVIDYKKAFKTRELHIQARVAVFWYAGFQRSKFKPRWGKIV